MHIEEVFINGFLSFNNFKIKLDKSSNIIVGCNGVGKSNFLKLINTIINKKNNLEYYKSEIYNDIRRFEITIVDLDVDILKMLLFINAVKSCYYNLLQGLNPILNELNCIYDKIKNFTIFDQGLKIMYDDNNKNIMYKFINCNCVEAPNHMTCDLNVNKIINHLHSKNNNNTITDIDLKIAIKNFVDNKINNKYTNKEILNLIINSESNKEYYDDKLKNADTLGDIFLKSFSTYNIEHIFESYLKNKINFCINDDYINITDIEELISNYDEAKKYLKDINIFNANKLKSLIKKELKDLRGDTREKLYFIRNNEVSIFNKIREKFNKITHKHFDIIQEDDDLYYKIIIDDTMHNISLGEEELINFLVFYYSDNKSIMLIDEPCSHLSSDNKKRLEKECFNSFSNIQMIIVTHDIEIINAQNQKIYYFAYDKQNNTKVTDIFNKNITEDFGGSIRKYIDESPEILFSKKCLFVEGYDDYRVLKILLKKTSDFNYSIIIMNGCNSNIWKLADYLNIEYKILYDNDKINNYDKKTVDWIFKNIDKNYFLSYIKRNKNLLLKIIDNKIITSDVIKSLKTVIFKFGDIFCKILLNFDKTLHTENINIKNNQHRNNMIINNFINIKKSISCVDMINYLFDKNLHIENSKCYELFDLLFKDEFEKEYNEYKTKEHSDNYLKKIYNVEDNKVYIWNSKIIDIEGFISTNTNKIEHNKIKDLNTEDLEKLIEESIKLNKHDEFISQLKMTK